MLNKEQDHEKVHRFMLKEYNYYNSNRKEEVLSEDDEDIEDESEEEEISDKEISDLDADIDMEGDFEDDLPTEEEGGEDISVDGSIEGDGQEIEVTDLVQRQDILKNAIDAIQTTLSNLNKEMHQNFQVLDQNLNADIEEVKNHINNRVTGIEKEMIKRNPTPNEKLAMQSPHTFPYNVKLDDFWAEDDTDEYQFSVKDTSNKLEREIEKNEEYIVNQDSIKYNDIDIKKSLGM